MAHLRSAEGCCNGGVAAPAVSVTTAGHLKRAWQGPCLQVWTSYRCCRFGIGCIGDAQHHFACCTLPRPSLAAGLAGCPVPYIWQEKLCCCASLLQGKRGTCPMHCDASRAAREQRRTVAGARAAKVLTRLKRCSSSNNCSTEAARCLLLVSQQYS